MENHEKDSLHGKDSLIVSNSQGIQVCTDFYLKFSLNVKAAGYTE